MARKLPKNALILLIKMVFSRSLKGDMNMFDQFEGLSADQIAEKLYNEGYTMLPPFFTARRTSNVLEQWIEKNHGLSVVSGTTTLSWDNGPLVYLPDNLCQFMCALFQGKYVNLYRITDEDVKSREIELQNCRKGTIHDNNI